MKCFFFFFFFFNDTATTEIYTLSLHDALPISPDTGRLAGQPCRDGTAHDQGLSSCEEARHVAFLVDVDQEREVERVVEDLAREWEGRIDVRLLGPVAAYDFVMTDSD